ncbi:hypothetical protein HDU79_005826 [Rhizoclosmatium sp. JEL0117]|nr:hypothetical protein HDU79_005826 [Rhizoclosmatium sp. JEL0117]
MAQAVARRFSKVCLNGGAPNNNNSLRQAVPKPATLRSSLATIDPPPPSPPKPRPSTPQKPTSLSKTDSLTRLITPSTRKSNVPRDRIKQLWSLIRSHFLTKPPGMLQLLQASNAAPPYAITLKQGFQFKYRLRTKYQIKCLVMHSRLPWHQPDALLDEVVGTVGKKVGEHSGGGNGNGNGGSSGDGDVGGSIDVFGSSAVLSLKREMSRVNLLSGLGAGRAGGSGGKLLASATGISMHSSMVSMKHDNVGNGGQGGDGDENEKMNQHLMDEDEFETKRISRILKPSTFVCADTSRTVRMWDISRNTQMKPKSIIKLDVDVFEFVYLAKFSMYASCNETKTISLFNQRFESVDSFNVEHYVQHLKYNTNLHELITIGSHELYLWTLENQINSKGHVTVKPTIKYKLYTNLPPNDWITGVSYDEERHRMYTIVNTKVVVFDLHDGKEVNRWLNISYRQINCIIYYEMYDYNIIGCSNGAIKIINMTNDMVHEFNSHTRPITSLAIYPYGPVVISCALDYTVRMYNLKTFKEVYCLHLKEKPTCLQVMDDLQLYISTWNTIMVWKLNHINTGFSTINTRVTHLMTAAAEGIPTRILVRSEDGVIRLVSPISGKVITTSLPLLETDCVKEIAYCPRIDRMFLLVESGEIWVIATNINPCVVVDIWSSAHTAREDVRCMLMFEGRLGNFDELPPKYNRKNGFVFLIAGTASGQILFYGTEGQIVHRNQVDPMSMHIINPLIAINTGIIPRKISVLDSTVCCSADDFIIRMFSFNTVSGEWHAIPMHNRSDDHTEEITSICCIEKSGLFVTTSRDSTIRVWDVYNALIREVKFHEPLDCLCVSNLRGDILVGIQNRIDIIKYNLYLPAGYIKSIDAMGIQDEALELPIQFDEKFDFLMNYLAQRRLHYSHNTDMFESGSKVLSTFRKLNFIGTIQPIVLLKEQMIQKKRAREQALLPKAIEDPIYLPIMNKLKSIMERRQIMINLMKKQAEYEYKEMEKRHNVLHQEFESFLKYKPYMGALYPVTEQEPEVTDEPINFLAGLEEDYIPPDPLALVFADEIQEKPPLEIVKGEDEYRIIEVAEDPILPLLDPRSPDPVEEVVAVTNEIDISDTIVKDIEETQVQDTAPVHESSHELDPRILRAPEPPPPEPKLKIAPDGEIPNSVMGRTVKNWKAIHAWNNMVSVSLFKKGRAKGDDIAQQKEKSKQSDVFKARLKNMLEDQARREEEDRRKRKEEQGGAVEEEERPPEEKPKLNDDDEDDPYSRPGLRSLLKPLKPLEMVKYPKLIDKAVGYSWFPKDDILHPKKPEDPDTALRKLKIENTSENVFPIVMECFKVLSTSKERKEAVQYMTWILEEFGIRDTTPMVRTYMKYLQNTLFVRINDDDETQMILIMLEACVNFGQTQTEFIPTVLMLLFHENETIREQAKSVLISIGAGHMLTAHVMKKIGDCYNRTLAAHDPNKSSRPSTAGRRSSVAVPQFTQLPTKTPVNMQGGVLQSPIGTECRNWIMAFLRKTLKNYLMVATTDLEQLEKLKELNDSGFVERPIKKKEEEEDADKGKKRRASQAQPPPLALVQDEALHKKKNGQTMYTSTPVLSELLAIHEVEPMLGNPVTILQNPTLKDFVTALTFYAKYNERRIAKEQADKAMKAEMEARALEEARLKREHDAKLAEFLRRKELERNKKNNDRRAKMLALRQRERTNDLPVIKKGGLREHLFTGCTHVSRCHPSRETLDGPYKFPPLPAGFTTSMALHLATMNKSMPVEHVDLAPFQESTQHHHEDVRPETAPSSSYTYSSRTRQKSNRRNTASASHSATFYNPESFRTTLEAEEALRYLQTPHLWEGDQMQDGIRQVDKELDYIRNGFKPNPDTNEPSPTPIRNKTGLHSSQVLTRNVEDTFKTGRKYFVPELEEDVERHRAKSKKTITDEIRVPAKRKGKKKVHAPLTQ